MTLYYSNGHGNVSAFVDFKIVIVEDGEESEMTETELQIWEEYLALDARSSVSFSYP